MISKKSTKREKMQFVSKHEYKKMGIIGGYKEGAVYAGQTGNVHEIL
ncbi:MAG: hypothetical protein K1W34_15260 [Lachnospiraceae bacterium]